MNEKHRAASKWPKKIAKELNPLDPEGVAVDFIAAGGRPTAGISLPLLGPSIQGNSDEALAEALPKRLPDQWDVGDHRTYRVYVQEALQYGLDEEQTLEIAKSKFLHDTGHSAYRTWQPPKRPTSPAPSNQGNGFSTSASQSPKDRQGQQLFPVPLPPKPQTPLNSSPSPAVQGDKGRSPAVNGFPTAIPLTPENRPAGLPKFPVPLPSKSAKPQGQAFDTIDPSADPKVASMVKMSSTPLDDPGRSALLKPVEKLTESEMADMIHSAQEDYRGWRSGDPLKAHTYEKVQDWHVNIYGDQQQSTDGGKPIEPTPIRPIPKQPSPHTTPQGEDLWQATARIGQKVAAVAGKDGIADAVTGLQRGLNMLGEANPLPARSPAYAPYTKLGPVDEDGQYGPQTDFALKQATARLGSAKVDEAFALGRFNTFARNAQRNGNSEGLEDKTHSIIGPLFRDPADNTAPKVEGGVLQETLNGFGQGLKVDNWIGPKTTEAFSSALRENDADELTRAFGRGLGLL